MEQGLEWCGGSGEGGGGLQIEMVWEEGCDGE